MKLATVLGALLLMGAVAPTRSDAGWKTLVSKFGYFSVGMPAEAVENYAPSQEAGGTVHGYMYTARSGSGVDFVACCWDYTNAPQRRLDADELDLSVKLEREHRRPGAFLVKTIRLGKVPGRELRINYPDGSKDVFRFYLNGRRLYAISSSTDGRRNGPDESRAFLESFRLL